MWVTLIPIIAKYGTEFAYKLWGNIKSNKEPTEADWQELIALSNKTYEDYLNEAQERLRVSNAAARVAPAPPQP